MRTRAKVIVLLCVLALLYGTIVRGAVGSTQRSYQNPVQSFTAQGKAVEGNLAGSSLGTEFIYDGTPIEFTQVYAVYWQSQSVTLVLLVNVTSTNFLFGNLYVYSQGSAFYLNLYNYSDGQDSWYTFSGSAVMGSTLVYAPSVPMPQLNIPMQAKYPNQIFVNGPDVAVNGNTGTWDGKNIVSAYNFINVTRQWNELWFLANDFPGGNYYWEMLYTFPDSPTDVKVGIQIYLNNLQFTPYPDGNRSMGTWAYGLPQPLPQTTETQVTVTTLVQEVTQQSMTLTVAIPEFRFGLLVVISSVMGVAVAVRIGERKPTRPAEV